MSQFFRARDVVIAGVGLAALLAGCGNDNTAGSGPSTTTATRTTAVTTSTANPLDTSAAAQRLCDTMRPRLQAWRTETTTPGRIDFNIMLLQWAFDAGGADGNIKLVEDKSIVDTLTGRACPDVRGQAISAFDVPDLAAAVAVP